MLHINYNRVCNMHQHLCHSLLILGQSAVDKSKMVDSEDRCSWQQYWCSVDISIPNVICLPPAWSKHERFLHQVHSVFQIGLLYFLFIQLYALNSLILFKMFIIGNEVWIYRKKIIIYIFFLFKCWLLHKELCFFEFLPFLVDLFNFVILTAMIYRPLLVIYIYSPWTFLFDWRPVAFHQI